ncbi:MAG: DEAD/DEAH box helicase [Acidobacteriota bacterium]|nr:MAG: DEAD/DEAH box helicase [Acidobacteriota bacterium]
MRGISHAGFTTPRPIQVQTIPTALEGRDILGLAQTGTGKTAAFALPVLEYLLKSKKRGGPRVLVVAPTRELANQINKEINLLARYTDLKMTTVFGGVPTKAQISLVRNHPDIIVACPGRLLDLHRQRVLPLEHVKVLILDEADHMFDMGFLPDLRRIIDALPAKRQNLMFSATMPGEIRILADRILDHPLVVDLNSSRPISTVDHALYPIECIEKVALLKHIFSERGFVSAIVFTRTKYRARRLAHQLVQSGHRAVALQGNMSQSQRTRAMEGFRRRRFDILVATDIAARGIDVQQVSHVVNFDMPSTVDAYTHRIGRTGRAERSGKAYTFVTGDDLDMVNAIERRIEAPIPRVVIERFARIPFPGNRFEVEQAGKTPFEKIPARSPRGRRGAERGRKSGRHAFRKAS